MCRMIKDAKKWNGYICHCHNEPELFLAQNVQSLNVVSFKSRFISKYPISSPRAAFIQSFESWESVPHNTGRGLDNSDTGILTAARMLEILHVNIQNRIEPRYFTYLTNFIADCLTRSINGPILMVRFYWKIMNFIGLHLRNLVFKTRSSLLTTNI